MNRLRKLEENAEDHRPTSIPLPTKTASPRPSLIGKKPVSLGMISYENEVPRVEFDIMLTP